MPKTGINSAAHAVLADETSAARSMQLHARGKRLGIVTESTAAADFVDDTFFPSGAFGVTIEQGLPHSSDLMIEDRVVHPDQLRDLLSAVASQLAPGEFEQIRGIHQPRYDAEDGVTVFSLSDWASGEPAALVRDGWRFLLIRTPSAVSDRWPSRIARDVVTRLAAAAGSLILHAAAFAVDGDAYLVVGDSGAGKSTTSIGLARLLDRAGWIGNDRIHLDQDSAGLMVTACPVALGINKGTLDAIGVTGADRWVLQAGQPGADSDWDQFMGEDKMRISPREVARYLDVEVLASARLAGVIFPRIDRAANFEFGPADETFARTTLARNFRSLDDNLFGEDWLEITPDLVPAPTSAEDLFAKLSAVPLVQCTLGRGDDLALLAEKLTSDRL